MKTKIFRFSKQTISLVLSILMVVSMMLVGMVSTSAYSISNATFYFVKPSGWSNTPKLAIGSSSKRAMLAPSYNIDGKVYAFQNVSFTDYDGYFFVDVSWSASEEPSDYWVWHNENSSHATDKIQGDTSGYIYKLNSGNSGQVSSDSTPNETVTVKAHLYDGTNHSENSSVGTVTVSGKNISGTSVSGSSVSIAKYTNAKLTATAKEGYEFVGWYDTSGNLKSTDETYTRETTATGTFYAYFREGNTTTDEVNAKSNSTLVVSYDKSNTWKAVHIWNTSSSVSNPVAMTAISDVTGLYYYNFDALMANESDSKISYLLKKNSANDWTGQSGDCEIEKDKQQYLYNNSSNESTSKPASSTYTPLTLKSITYDSEIFNDSSTSITVTPAGGIPNFLNGKLTNNNKQYKLTVKKGNETIADGLTASYNGTFSFEWDAEYKSNDTSQTLTFVLTDGVDTVTYDHTFSVIINTPKYSVISDSNLQSGASLKFSETSGGSAVSEFEEGATVYVTVTSPTGYDCTGVTYTYNGTTATALGSGNSYTFIMKPYATTVNATFAKKTYNITYDTPNGLTYKTKPTTAQYDDSVTVEFTIADGYTCTDVTGGNNGSYSNGTYTFTMPAGNVTVKPTVSAKSVVKPSVSINLVNDSSSTVNMGQPVEFTTGYTFSNETYTEFSTDSITLTKDGATVVPSSYINGTKPNYTFTANEVGTYVITYSVTVKNKYDATKTATDTATYTINVVYTKLQQDYINLSNYIAGKTTVKESEYSAGATEYNNALTAAQEAVDAGMPANDATSAKYEYATLLENFKSAEAALTPAYDYYVGGRFQVKVDGQLYTTDKDPDDTTTWHAHPNTDEFKFTKVDGQSYYKLNTGLTRNEIANLVKADSAFYFFVYAKATGTSDSEGYSNYGLTGTDKNIDELIGSSNFTTLVNSGETYPAKQMYFSVNASGSDYITFYFEPSTLKFWYDASPKYSLTTEVTNPEYGSVSPTSGTYAEGQSVTLSGTSNSDYVITKVVLTGETSGKTTTVYDIDTSHKNDDFSVAFSMPGENTVAKVTFGEKPSYTVDFTGDPAKGSVTATYNNSTVDGHTVSIAQGDSITLKATANSGYSFSTWTFSNEDFEYVLGNATSSTITIRPTSDIAVEAEFVVYRGEVVTDHNLLYNSNKDSLLHTTNTNKVNTTMYKTTYTPSGESTAYTAYYATVTAKDLNLTEYKSNQNYYFGITKNAGSTGKDLYATNLTKPSVVVLTADSIKAVANDGTKIEDRNDGGYTMYCVNLYMKDASITDEITIMYVPDKNTYYLSATLFVTEDTIKVYGKDGTARGSGSTSDYGKTTVTGDANGNSTTHSDYVTYYAIEGEKITVTTVVNDSYANKGYYVEAYVIDGVKYDVVSTGKNTYQIAVPYTIGTADVEITPVYYNSNIDRDNDYITIYVDASTLGNHWGNTISIYSYYYGTSSGTVRGDGNYPGQPLMLDPSGYYVGKVSKHAYIDGKQQSQTISGITLNNYYEGETVHQKFLPSEAKKNLQTYDYDDFKWIAEMECDTLRFDIKYEEGDPTNQKAVVNNKYGNGTSSGYPSPQSSFNIDKYGTFNGIDAVTGNAQNGWEYLLDFDGDLVSILGYTDDTVPSNVPELDRENPLRIVSVGNQHTAMGEWSTIWYVYDSNDRLVTQGLPSDFIPRVSSTEKDENGYPKELALSSQKAAYRAIVNAGLQYKTAFITYESEQDASTSYTSNSGTRLDGRWYYTRSVEQVKIETAIIYADSETSEDWKEDPYASGITGTNTNAEVSVNRVTSLTVDRNTIVEISATHGKSYKFVGWATKNEDGTYTKSTTLTWMQSNFTVSVDTKLYAMYVPTAEGEILLSHTRYTGPGAGGGSGIFWISATVTHNDNSTTKYDFAENSLTIPKILTTDKTIEFTLKTYSYAKSTFNYFYIPDGTGLNQHMADNEKTGFVSTDSDLASITMTIPVEDNVFDSDGTQLMKTVRFYSDLSLPVVDDTIVFNHELYSVAPKDANDAPANSGTGTPLMQVVITDDKGNEVYNSGTGAKSKVTIIGSDITSIIAGLQSEEKINYIVKVIVSTKNADTMCNVYRADYNHNATTEDPYNYITAGSDSIWSAETDYANNKVTYTYDFNELFTYETSGFKYKVNNVNFYSDHTANQLTVTFKYYDRKVLSGTPSDIDTTATSFTTNMTAHDYAGKDGANAALDALVIDALADRNIDNVIDTYKIWPTQSEAVKGIQEQTNLKTKAKYGALEYHTDCYGDEATDGEKWVTYYDANGNVISEADAYGEKFFDIKNVTVWFYNTLKDYTVTTYSIYDENGNEAVQRVGDYFIGIGKTTTHNAYYNQRIGYASEAGADDDIDQSTAYLKKIFGKEYKGYTETSTGAVRSYINDNQEYRFLYWSLDNQGKTIVSSSRTYGYRISKDITLYPVYGIWTPDTEFAPGLTVTASAKDEYVDANGVQRTRINTVMNPYNCPDDDTCIEQVSVIYVKLGADVEASSIDMAKMREGIKDALAKCTGGSGTSYSVEVNVEQNAYGAIEYVYKVTENTLTNKNRVQFTQSFKNTLLEEGGSYSNMLVFAAMYYNYADTDNSDGQVDGWIVSDNCIYYKNGEEKTI